MINTDFIRKQLHNRLGIDDHAKRNSNEVSQEIKRMVDSLNYICELCKPRLIMGGIRYGSEWKHEAMMKYMQPKFDTFKKSGNFEMLVDLVNFCAIENVLHTHPNFHFKGEDRK